MMAEGRVGVKQPGRFLPTLKRKKKQAKRKKRPKENKIGYQNRA